MALILLFLLLLLVCFGVLLYFLKPSSMERAVEEQLGDISASPGAFSDSTTILKQEAVNANPFWIQIINLVPWAPAAARLIRQSGQGWQLGPFLLLSMLAGLGGAFFTWVFTENAIFALAMAVAIGVAPYGYLFVLRQVRFKRFETLLPEAVDLMSRGLRAGHSITAVLEMVGKEIADPVGLEFRALHKEQSLGLPTREAMMNLVGRVPVDDMRFLATAILLQKESGGNLAQILDKTSSVIRERARLRGQLRIYTAQGRITGWILCFAPFLMFGLISVTNRNYAKTLVTDPLGLKMVYTGLVLMILGVLAIRKIIDVKV